MTESAGELGNTLENHSPSLRKKPTVDRSIAEVETGKKNIKPKSVKAVVASGT